MVWWYFTTKQNFNIIMFSDAKLFESRCKFIPRQERQGYLVFCRTLNSECRVPNDSEAREARGGGDPTYERGGDARRKF